VKHAGIEPATSAMPFLPARPRRSNVIRQAGRHGKSGAGFGVRFDKPTPGPSPPSVLAKQALEHFNRAQDALKEPGLGPLRRGTQKDAWGA